MPAQSVPKVTFNRSHQPSAWRVYFRGKSYWFREEKDALGKKADLQNGSLKARFTARQLDDYAQSLEILGGVPVLRAVRYFAEHNGPQLVNRTRTVKELSDDFLKRVRGRPKYVAEVKRNVGLLVEFCGKRAVAEISPTTIEEYLGQFASHWSHDAALKFAKAFFKWTTSPLVKARSDNPCEGFAKRNPIGTKVYLSLEDTQHVLSVCRREFAELLPAIGLQLFAGIRTEEIIRMDWQSVRRGTIRINPEVGKMGQVKGKQAVRIIDWWPAALEATMPPTLRTAGPIANNYRDRKVELIRRCHATKADFRWGQNAFRHSYGTYGLAFFQSASRMCLLMGERDADTLHNYYAEYETQQRGQGYFSLGASKPEPLPMSHAAVALLQNMMRQFGEQAGNVANAPLPPTVAGERVVGAG